MSQSDYIKYKRVSTQLYLDAAKNQTPVFTSQTYLDYEQYQLENVTINLCNNYSLLTPVGKQIVFDMEKRVSTCPTFKICTDTNKRPHRTPLPQVYFTPKYQPLNWRNAKKLALKKDAYNCAVQHCP